MSERSHERPRRRDFMVALGGAMAATGAGAAAWPFVDSMNPAPGARDAAALAIEISSLSKRRAVLADGFHDNAAVIWRTDRELAALALSAPARRRPAEFLHRAHATIPAYADNWHRSIRPEIAVLVPWCPFDEWPLAWDERSLRRSLEARDEFMCERCCSHFDLAGRCFSGPADDLSVPRHRYLAPTWLVIGEDPPGYGQMA